MEQMEKMEKNGTKMEKNGTEMEKNGTEMEKNGTKWKKMERKWKKMEQHFSKSRKVGPKPFFRHSSTILAQTFFKIDFSNRALNTRLLLRQGS